MQWLRLGCRAAVVLTVGMLVRFVAAWDAAAIQVSTHQARGGCGTHEMREKQRLHGPPEGGVARRLMGSGWLRRGVWRGVLLRAETGVVAWWWLIVCSYEKGAAWLRVLPCVWCCCQ